MGIISWIVLGLIAGALAKFFMPGKQGGGFIATVLLGVIGAFVGGFIGSFLGWGEVNSFDFRSVLLAMFGSIVVLWLYGMATRK